MRAAEARWTRCFLTLTGWKIEAVPRLRAECLPRLPEVAPPCPGPLPTPGRVNPVFRPRLAPLSPLSIPPAMSFSDDPASNNPPALGLPVAPLIRIGLFLPRPPASRRWHQPSGAAALSPVCCASLELRRRACELLSLARAQIYPEHNSCSLAHSRFPFPSPLHRQGPRARR